MKKAYLFLLLCGLYFCTDNLFGGGFYLGSHFGRMTQSLHIKRGDVVNSRRNHTIDLDVQKNLTSVAPGVFFGYELGFCKSFCAGLELAGNFFPSAKQRIESSIRRQNINYEFAANIKRKYDITPSLFLKYTTSVLSPYVKLGLEVSRYRLNLHYNNALLLLEPDLKKKADFLQLHFVPCVGLEKELTTHLFARAEYSRAVKLKGKKLKLASLLEGAQSFRLGLLYRF